MDTRTRLLDGFEAQLLDEGYLGVSTAELAQQAGIQRPSLYHHFPDGKQQLFTEVAMRMIEADAARVTDALASSDALRSRLVELAMIHADDPRKATLWQRIYDGTRYVDDETRTLVSTRYVEDLLRPATALMRTAVEDRELRDLDPDFLMNAFFGMATVVQEMPPDVAMPVDKRPARRQTARELAEQVVDVFLAGAGA